MMKKKLYIPKKITAILVYGRPPLAFAAMLCAIAVMWTHSPLAYLVGVLLLCIATTFDLLDGWFAARFGPHPILAQLADRIMDKIVYSIIFPLVSVGMMWRLISAEHTKGEMLNAILVLLLCVTVLVRDNFAHFMRGFAVQRGLEPEARELTRLRTIVAAPVGTLLYAHAFYLSALPATTLSSWVAMLGNFPLRGLFLIEIIFLIINFGSIAAYCRKYGTACLDELCLDDHLLRRRILAMFPNALTVMNGMMGLLAVFVAYQAHIREAYLLLIGAAVFDKLDGAMARKLGLTETPVTGTTPHRVTLGGILDDVADAVSFCIVPSWIFYLTLSDFADPLMRYLPVALVAVLYTALGIARLIYFTLDRTPIPGFFKGLPTPAAALLATTPLIMFSQAAQQSIGWARFWALVCLAIMLLAAFLMNRYSLHYLHLGRFMDHQRWFGHITALLFIIFWFTPYFGLLALAYLLLYVFSPTVTRRLEPDVSPAGGQSAEP